MGKPNNLLPTLGFIQTCYPGSAHGCVPLWGGRLGSVDTVFVITAAIKQQRGLMRRTRLELQTKFHNHGEGPSWSFQQEE